KDVKFDYKTEGTIITGLVSTNNGLIVGGSMFPMQFFSYNLDNKEWKRSSSDGQYNAFSLENNQLFVGSYPDGQLLLLDVKENLHSEPRRLAEAAPFISRPFDIITCHESNTVIMAGQPSATVKRGGLLFVNSVTGTSQFIKK